MLKFTMQGEDGRTRLGIGLNKDMLDELQAGKNIPINFGDMEIEGDLTLMSLDMIEVWLVYADTNNELMERLKPMFRPETVHDMRAKND